jgi:tetratricopeptide (TPR) repeat protein
VLSSILIKRIDEDPKAAIAAARTILAAQDLFDETNRKMLVSIVLTDAGSECKDPEAVNEAVTLLEQLHLKLPGDPNIMYNLAKALITRADLPILPLYTDWCAVTSVDRVRAKKFFQSVAGHPSSEGVLRARALTNLGNALARNWRLIEAYDCYARAVEYDPENGVAISNAAKASMI